ncbi:hypothetical protein HYW46_00575 [Candidatus Daviesbacteria bacterium]|nr:hypothetical protein [Candidatus Daviesbacteria bacterium]
MNFEKLLKKLKALNLPRDEFVVVSSGSMAVRGIRDARDLDILVTDKLWSSLSEKYPIKNENGIDKIEVHSKDIEILGAGSIFRDSSIASLEEIFRSADIFDGIRYINLELLKKFKQKWAGKKI